MNVIKIEAKRFTGTSKSGKEYDFIAHKIVGKDGKKTDVMFTKNGNAKDYDIGKMEGNFVLFVDKDEVWKARGERKYPLYFIRNISRIDIDAGAVTYPYADTAEEVKDDEIESDLPF